MAKKDDSYWKERFEQIENSLNSYGQDVYKQIEPVFEAAQRNIQGKIEVWYGRFATNNNISMVEARRMLASKELKELKWDVNEYIKHGKENAHGGTWMKELENASAKYHISRLEALKLQTQQELEVAYGNETDFIDRMARKIYTDGYYHTTYEVQKGFNLGWDIGTIDKNKLKKIISKPWAADGKNFSDRIWQSKMAMVSELHNELVRTCILGKAPDDAIKHMTKFVDKKFKNAKMQAGRLVMTEQAFFASAAQKDCFHDLDVEQFEIVATLDSHTSAICQEMDGKVFAMKDFNPGVTAPPFHCWCRSCTVPYFDDEFNIGKRAARGEDGKTYYVPSDMKYPEWKEKYVDNISKSGIIPLSDISIHKSLGAASFNYPVRLPNGKNVKLAEGTKITKVFVFAGAGTNKQIKVAKYLEKQYGVPESAWKKVRGDGYVVEDGTNKHVELHWFESEETGRIQMKVKRYFNDES